MVAEAVPESNDIGTSVAARPGDTLGYARVSTNEQNPEAQRARLIDAGAIRVFTDVISGKRFERPGLAELIDHARPGDRLCVVRLDRLGRSLRELLETVDTLKARGIHLVSLEERLDTSSAAGELVFHVFGAIAHRGARRLTRRRFPRRANSSKAACRPLGPRNSSRSAGQRLTESPLRCATRIRRPYRNPTNKPSDDAVNAPARICAGGAGYPAPPAQIRAGALTHTAPASGQTSAALSATCRLARLRGPQAACVTRTRHSVRYVLWPVDLPLAPVLRSIDSAGTLIPLFADFTATMTESDSSSPFVSGYDSSVFPSRPRH